MTSYENIVQDKYWQDLSDSNAEVVKSQIKLEDGEDITFHSPNTNDLKYCKLATPNGRDESGGEDDLNISSSPFYLLDHGYGRTPPTHAGDNQRPVASPTKTLAVKRNLMDTTIEEDSGFKTPKLKKKNTIIIKTKGNNLKTATRYDTSLGLLTKKFVDLLQRSPRGIVDLNYASASLDVQKRRIYDITNVLEGVGILEKKSKNNIQWRGGNISEPQSDVQNDIEKLENEERVLDDLINKARNEFDALIKDSRYAYVTYQDLRSIKTFATQTVMVIKAPPTAHLEVPQPVNRSKVEMILKSDKDEIEVFLCPDPKPGKDEKDTRSINSNPSTPSAVGEASTLGKMDSPDKMKLPRFDNEASNPNIFLSPSDDYQPYQLRTEDQHSSEADAPPSPFSEEHSLLSLQPPICGSDYLYSLDRNEGLMDLFDIDF